MTGTGPITLFCFAHAGAGASAYRSWVSAAPFRVVPVQYPGREDRIAEEPFSDIGALAAHVERRVLDQVGGGRYALFGHSMGSYIGMAYLMQHSCSLQGAVLSGSNYQPVALYKAARLIAGFERWRLGPTGRSRLIDFLSFGSFNKAFKPNRTGFDWLSRDPVEVDRYVTDPLCGFVCTTQLWCDLMDGFQQITPVRNLAQIDADLPLLVIGGDRDPVSQGKRLGHLAGALRTAGIKDVELKIYPDARHELLNESNRDEVTHYLRDWLERTLVRSRSCATPIEEPV